MPKISFLSQSYFATLFFWGGVTPPGGVQGGPPSKILSDYENIGINLCPCQKSASYLKKCGRAPPSTFFGGVSGVVLGVFPPGGVQSAPTSKIFQIMII